MSNDSISCYVIPAVPIALLLPVECVASVVVNPKIVALKDSTTNWMRGHITWKNQRVPVLSYSALHDSDLNEKNKNKPQVVVLNPIPDATRKAYAGILCFGKIKQVKIDPNITKGKLPDNIDRRYAEAVVINGKSQYLIPKLSALGVAFTYF